MPSDANAAGVLPRPQHCAPVSISGLARLSGADPPDVDVEVTGITASSKHIRQGDLFAALPGRSGHGARFADRAMDEGAVAVLTDPAGRALVDARTPMLVVPDVRACLGEVAAAVYGSPSNTLAIAGVTGTSGKTTTTYLVRAGLRAAHRACGLIGTVATLIGDDAVATGFTTPEAPEIQALLAVMSERGVRDVAMEVSSHALAMGRADAIAFDVAAFTNLSQDHLDFHTDMDEYFAAKARLFDGRASIAVVMIDDDWGRRLAAQIGPAALTVSAEGDTAAAWRALDARATPDGRTAFQVVGPDGHVQAGSAIPGRYNVANALLAIAILSQLGVAPDLAADAVAGATVPGRMERVEAGQPFMAIVDYSHKPAAIAGALAALRPLTAGRLIVVLGCGGDRDRAKRSAMGAIAARGSDLLIITDDNPRSEDPGSIRAAMLGGALALSMAERGQVREIGDRAEAISAAVTAAEPGDTVLVAGKGHEQGQEINGVTVPFDDRDALRAALRSMRR
ncbi:MAG: UDP-N-acetylmuramoyl-L-alanyl-D-glutamate--2,6-diaminopimelate ligase [Actinomycetota bacterium]|nr:UDP-N-acetylmuramoyl-L-alanyl-D-glutamate--2,6-diaminopimelate ligase [Actinomycetota bacterium]